MSLVAGSKRDKKKKTKKKKQLVHPHKTSSQSFTSNSLQAGTY